jgi:hypothetical protein
MTLCKLNHVVLCMQDYTNQDAFYDNDHPRVLGEIQEIHHSAEAERIAPVPYRTLDNGTKKIIGLAV